MVKKDDGRTKKESSRVIKSDNADTAERRNRSESRSSPCAECSTDLGLITVLITTLVISDTRVSLMISTPIGLVSPHTH